MNTQQQKALEALETLGANITTETELLALDYLHDYIVSGNQGRVDMPKTNFVEMASKIFGMDRI